VPPELGGLWGGATPPLLGSGPPGELPLPPVPPPPVLGVCCGNEGEAVPPLDGVPDGAAGVTALGVAPAPPLEEPLFAFFFLLSPGAIGLPVEIGGAGCWNVDEFEPELPPPLEATAITTIRKNATPATATSLRRR
jgi:hypothetical protein